jgi:DNA polymerase III epsilon subunit-like protein
MGTSTSQPVPATAPRLRVIYDCETTGLVDPRIVQVAASAENAAGEIRYHEMLANPGFRADGSPAQIDRAATELHGLTRESVERFPEFADGVAQEMASRVVQWAGELLPGAQAVVIDVVAHVGDGFDYPVLLSALRGRPIEDLVAHVPFALELRWHDSFYAVRTLQMTGAFALPNCKLRTAHAALGARSGRALARDAPIQWHQAIGDVLALGDICAHDAVAEELTGGRARSHVMSNRPIPISVSPLRASTSHATDDATAGRARRVEANRHEHGP